MKDNNSPNQLLQLRSKIDDIDNQIINLLNQRIRIIEEVSEYKRSINEKFFIKSAREADMIKALIAKADPKIPKSTIATIWRKIITSANCLEQGLKIAIHNPNKIIDYNYLVKEYYSDFVPLISHDSVNNVVLALEKNEAQIGIFALPKSPEDKSENWWINLANNCNGIRVFAKIPFIGESPYNLVAVAKKEPEKSEDDKTLLSIEVDKKFNKIQVSEALKLTKIKFKILQSTSLEQINNIDFYLVEIDGFFDEKSLEITNFSKSEIKPFVKVLGHFAKGI